MFIPRRAIVRFFFLFGLALGGPAWSAAEPAAVPPADEVVRLDPFRAAGRNESRAAVFAEITGLSGNLRDVARAVTVVSRGQLDDLAVSRVEDLSPLVAGAVSAPPYGLTGVPTLRGDLGDAAQNGQRRAFNRNVFPVSFNGVESVEVMAGAPPAFLGYSSGTGGFVNFITKRPAFQGRQVAVRSSLGSWNDFRWQIDATAPLSDTVAYRLSVERVDRGSFYQLAGERSWDAYVALAWRPDRAMRWDFSAEAYSVRYLENPGTNRPTQALIDRGEYITGSSVQHGGAGVYLGNTFTPTGTARVDGSQILAAPGDGAAARNYTAQLVGSRESAGGRQIVSRTYFESVHSEKHATYHFYSYVPLSLTLEQRLELRESHAWGGHVHTLLWGAAVRGEERRVYVEFFNEAMNAFDLTLDPASIGVPINLLRFVLPVPGRPGQVAQSGARYGTPPSVGASQTLHSRLGSGGLFLQDQVALTKRVALLVSLRGDALAVKSEDPLPRPGFAPVRDGLTAFLPAATGSLTWRPVDALTAYATYNDAAAVESSSSSGGFGLTGNRLPAVLFENRSRLAEVGAKLVTREGRLTGNLALYHQRRHRTNPRAGLPDEIVVRGAELAGAWRATARWEFSGNGALSEARYVDGPLPGSVATVPGFDPASPSSSFGSYPRGNYRVPGLPRWQGNLAVRFDAGRGWGLRVWSSFQGAQNLDLFGRVQIRAQQTWNAGVTWRHGAWELRGDGLNVTDEFNWRPTSTPFAGGDLVSRELPRHWRVAARYRF